MDKKVEDLLEFLVRAPLYLSDATKSFTSKGHEGIVFLPGDASRLKKMVEDLRKDNQPFWIKVKDI